MAQFPITYSTKLPSGQNDLRRIRLDSDTGEAGIARSVQGLGAEVFRQTQVERERKNRKTEDKLQEAERARKKREAEEELEQSRWAKLEQDKVDSAWYRKYSAAGTPEEKAIVMEQWGFDRSTQKNSIRSSLTYPGAQKELDFYSESRWVDLKSNAELAMDRQEEKRLEERDKADAFAQTQNGKFAIDALDDKWLRTISSTNNLGKIEEYKVQWKAERDELASTTATHPTAQENLKFYSQGSWIKLSGQADIAADNIAKEQANLAFHKDITNDIAAGKYDIVAQKAQSAYDNSYITASEKEQVVAVAAKAKHDSFISSIKTEASNAMGETFDEAKGYAVVDKYYNAGLISIDEKENMESDVRNFKARASAEEKKTKYEKEKQAVMSFADVLSQDQNLAPDAVGMSGLDDKDKEIWTAIAANQYEPPMPDDTQNFVEVRDDLLLFAQKAVSEKELIQKWSQMRYTGYISPDEDAETPARYISDQTYKWAIEKIKKPYDVRIAQDVQQTIQNNVELLPDPWWKGLKTRQEMKMAANKKFFNWLDKNPEASTTDIENQYQYYITGNQTQEVLKVSPRLDSEIHGITKDGRPASVKAYQIRDAMQDGFLVSDPSSINVNLYQPEQ